uniref:Reverse transcriptase domain-containing protein n=1 Tax=Oryzias sinensis TaxID=183150 RepID=A0A8C7Y900_9TELE
MRMANGTAPGPDRISKKALLDWDPRGEQLARLYTTWLIGGVIPRVFKECRTKLLPKSSDPVELQDIGGWRPVTIGSMVTRLFSRILTMRLTRACPINPRQRGFLASSSGCAENLLIFDEIVRRSRLDGGPLAVVFVDFARAFDSISHEHILCVLEESGVDRHVIELIRNSYVDCVTRVGCVEGMTQPIQMKVGVKQGDPMSPLLFNLAMDPLIHKLETAGTGLKWGDLSIATLAFADDLVLVSDSEEGMGRSLGILEKFCQLTGLRVQPKKCHGFFMDKGAVNGCGTWEICGSPIHMIPPGESVRYLGVQVGPGRGVMEPDLIPTVRLWIERISEAPLKPSQRMKVLNSFALPRIIYQADLGKVTVTKLAQIDGIVRKAVKKWLHLSPSTCNGLLYSRNRDGGLGLLKLERLIPSVRTKRIYRMSRSPDIWTRRMTSHSVSKSDWEMLWVQAGGERGKAPVMGAVETAQTDVERSPDYPDWRREENLAWSALRVQGVGADQFRGDRTSSSWISEPASVGFAQRHWLAALALRAGVYPTREFLARGKEKSGAACRRCPARLESCSHILGQCPFVQASRIARHHKVCVLLATEAEKFGWTVIREFRLEDAAGGLKIPDLVCKKADTVLIVDVTVRYEMDGETLKRAASEKVEHYLPVGKQITDKVGGRCFKVMGFPVGARGKWPASNNAVLAELGVPAGRMRTFARLVSRRTLLYSLDILRDFMREPAGRGTRVALIPAATGAAN